MRLGRKWDIMGFHGPSTRFTVIGWIIKENCLGSHESDESRRESGKSLRNYPSVNQFSSILTGSFSFCSVGGDTDPGARRVVLAWDFMGRLCGEPRRQTVCKPGSVLDPRADGWPFLWDARYRTPRATNPDGGRERPSRPPSLPGAAPVPIRSCSRWGLPCRDRCRPRGALLPHPFTLARGPLPAAQAVCFLWHCPWGRPRRALPGTVFPWSPDFPPPAPPKRRRKRPSDRLAILKIGSRPRGRKAPDLGCRMGAGEAGRTRSAIQAAGRPWADDPEFNIN